MEWWIIAPIVGVVPLARAWAATRDNTLRHAVAWAGVAWLAWVALPLYPDSRLAAYLALSLTACAGVAVLGARRPGVGAWNFVVAGLLLLLLRPLLEGLGTLRLEPAHLVILGVGLFVTVGNYLPTGQGPAALLLGACCGAYLAWLAGQPVPDWARHPAWSAAVPWLVWALMRRRDETDADSLWRAFRDRFGFAWAARQREQFNRAAENAGLDAHLGWGRVHGPADRERVRELLRATLKRFDARG